MPHFESALDIERDVAAVGKIGAVPILLKVLCDITGMGFAAVARVSAESWTACAVRDTIQFGLTVGGRLELNTTLCAESRAARLPIIIEHASNDPIYRDHCTPKIYKIESYVSVPIVLRSGSYFGNLCAIDPRPARVADPKILPVFQDFAHLIAMQLDADAAADAHQQALLDERATSELREQFIAILGHDLRSPLQSIIAGCEFLSRKHDDPASLMLLTRMKVSVRRMSTLINDVLDFARGKLGGGIGVDIKPAANIDAALDSVVREFRDAQPQRDIRADIAVSAPMQCDVGRLQQVASNLLGNALTHGRQESAVIFRARTERDALLIEVWNDGEPIPKESLAKIFEPFWRNTTQSNREGLGLGLHICAQIVRAHGGTIDVDSTSDAGTTFRVRLPCGISASL